MNKSERIKKAVEVIYELRLENVIRDSEEIYQSFRDVDLFELAELITDMNNTIYQVRKILEDE